MEAKSFPKSLLPLERNLNDVQVLELYRSGRIPYVLAEDDEWLASVRAIIPKKLKRAFSPKLLITAAKQGIIRFQDNGTLEWLPESKVLLAYLVGRIYCGDKLQFSARLQENMWRKSRKRFPSKEVEMLFGIHNLGNHRRRGRFQNIPQGAEIIDSLIVTSK